MHPKLFWKTLAVVAGLMKYNLDQLMAQYHQLNARFFNGQLPSGVHLEWSEQLTQAAGKALRTSEGYTIRLSVSLLQDRPQDLIQTLVHEMIHLLQWVEGIEETAHGPFFSATMHRINRAAPGEFVVTVTHDIQQRAQFEQDTLLGKIKKLLALSESPNHHEALAAATKAQALMAQHQIDATALENMPEGSELDEPLICDRLWATTARNCPTWRKTMAWYCCAANHCHYTYRSYHGFEIYGRRPHVAMTQHLFAYFCQAIEREVDQHRGQETVVFLNRFREAMALECGQRLVQHRSGNVAPSTAALALTDRYRQDTQTFLRLVVPNLRMGRNGSQRQPYLEATEAGRQAGRTISVAEQLVPTSRRFRGH